MSGAGHQLLEREAELAALGELASSAVAGEGQVVLIEGSAGIGKTRLVAEAVTVGRSLGFGCHAARGSELERDFAFGVVRQLLESHLAGLPPRDRRKLLSGAAALALPVFPSLGERHDARAAYEAQHAVLHGLYWLVAKLAEERPLLLTVDDAHWADAPSLRFLAYLANRVHDLPVLIVVGLRPAEPGAPAALLDQLATGSRSQQLAPAPLTEEAVGRLARALLGADLEPEFVATCAEVTGGNPFFLGELLGSLVRDGAPLDAARVRGAVPAGVVRSVARRLARMPAEAVAMARAVAVLGDDVEIELAARLADLDEAAATAAAEVLVRADILGAEGMKFVHPIVRTAVYTDMPQLVRAREHGRASRLLADRGGGDVRIALHLLAGAPAEDPWAVAVLRRAAESASGRGAPDVAATYLRRALAEPPSAEDRAGVLVELGRAEVAARGGQEGYAHMRQAMGEASMRHERVQIALELGRALFTQAFFPEAGEVFRVALEELDGSDPALRRELETELMTVAFVDLAALKRLGGLDGLRATLGSGRGGDEPLRLANIAWIEAARVPPAATGGEIAERALSVRGRSAERDSLVLSTAAIALMAADRLDLARRTWDDAATEAAARGSLPALRLALTLRAVVLVRIGAIPAAHSDIRTVTESAGDFVPGNFSEDLQRLVEELRLSLPWLLSPMIEVLLEQGEPAAASQAVKDAGLADEFPELYQFNYLLYSLGRVRLAEARAGEGIALLRECGRRLGEWGILNPGAIPWRAALAPALAAAGDVEEAAALAGEELELARRFEVPRELGMALRAAALVAGGDVELLREASDVLADSPSPLEHARALTDLGAALRRGGHRTDAREPLRVGLYLALRCGATALGERAHGELIAAGARPRRVALSGWESLTVSEQRVARLVADGLTNREIAERLFVSEKTVEGHLGNVYRKLEIRSRTQLPQIVRAAGPEL